MTPHPSSTLTPTRGQAKGPQDAQAQAHDICSLLATMNSIDPSLATARIDLLASAQRIVSVLQDPAEGPFEIMFSVRDTYLPTYLLDFDST